MKKLLALLNTPLRAVIAVGLFIMAGEYLLMAVIEPVFSPFMTHEFWKLIDPLLLVAIVSPALYLLFFRPMCSQQDELEAACRNIEQAHREWMDALDAVEEPIFLHDKEFRILRCNQAYRQRAAIPFHEIIGKPYYEVFPKTGVPLASCLRATAKAEEEEEVEIGGAIYRSRAFSIRDEQGAYLYSMHTLEDITTKKQAEGKLRLFRQLLDHARDGISIVDPDTGYFLDVNEALCNHLGYTREELLQRSVLDIQSSIADVSSWQEHSQELRKQGAALMEFESLHKDGSRVLDEISLRYVSIENHDFIIATVRDISERRRAEKQLAAQMKELRDWHDVTLGREMRIIELKREVDELLSQEGKPPRYAITNGHGNVAAPDNETCNARFPLLNPLPQAGEEANERLREFHVIQDEGS